METDRGKFYRDLPKVELHAHLNGSISTETMRRLVRLHRERWPGEAMPDQCDLVVEGGEYGTSKDPFLIFPVIHAVTDNLEAVRIVTREVIKEFAEDGVRYLELRTTPREVPGRMTGEEYCEAVLDQIRRAAKEEATSCITVKLLLSIDRRKLAGMDDIVRLYHSLKKNSHYDKILVGLDISGDPRVGDLRTVLDKMTRLRSEEGIKMAIHLAEIANPEETSAVLDTCHVGLVRLGHGTCIPPSLGGSDTLLEQLTRAGCPVETCLSSNVVCHTVPSYSAHQARIYHDRGIPIRVFNCNLSQELRTASESFGWNRDTLYRLERDALSHTFCGEEEREELRGYWGQWRREHEHFFRSAEAVIIITDDQKLLLEKQNTRLVTEFKASKLEAEAQKNWDLFYKRNETNFFKDRHWTTREFQELIDDGLSGDGDQDQDTRRRVLLEVGCGVGNFAFPLLEEKLPFYFFCCDFSPRAVQFVKNNPLYDEERIRAFHCDLTTDTLVTELGPDSVDIVTAIFVLSAIHPDKHGRVFTNLATVLRPGGLLLFRDYGLHDMAMLRFKPGSKISDQFYTRQDGTRSYFFTEAEVTRLGEEAGLEVYSAEIVERRTVNMKEGVNVPRLFVQSKFRKK